jgi:putative membrane protein insertion efficiency factor
MRSLLLALVRGYRRWLSPLKPPCCRFLPTCSGYALEALSEHGALVGSLLAARRVLRCHPFGGSGYDPVPPRRPRQARTPATVRAGPAAPRLTLGLAAAARWRRRRRQGPGSVPVTSSPESSTAVSPSF